MIEHTTQSTEAWLTSLPVKAELTDFEQRELLALYGSAGLSHLICLLMGSKQAFLIQLANLPLATSGDAARASVIQGQIKGIELVRETLLELTQPAVAETPEGARTS